MPNTHRYQRLARLRSWSNSPFWTRLNGHLTLINRRKAGKPNPPSPVIPHVPPKKKPGHGLTGIRADLHKLMHATIGNPYGWTYNEIRPLYLPKRRLTKAELANISTVKKALWHLVKNYRSDCSFGAKTLFWLAGAHDDPTGENWGPWGNSSTIYAHLPKRFGLDNAYHPAAADLARCKVGDIGTVGTNGSEHVWVVMEEGSNPLVWADGHGGAPDSYRALDDPRRPISVCIPKGIDAP